MARPCDAGLACTKYSGNEKRVDKLRCYVNSNSSIDLTMFCSGVLQTLFAP